MSRENRSEGQEEEQCVLGTTDNTLSTEEGWDWEKGKVSLGHMVFDIMLETLDLTLNATENPDVFSGTSQHLNLHIGEVSSTE